MYPGERFGKAFPNEHQIHAVLTQKNGAWNIALDLSDHFGWSEQQINECIIDLSHHHRNKDGYFGERFLARLRFILKHRQDIRMPRTRSAIDRLETPAVPLDEPVKHSNVLPSNTPYGLALTAGEVSTLQQVLLSESRFLASTQNFDSILKKLEQSLAGGPQTTWAIVYYYGGNDIHSIRLADSNTEATRVAIASFDLTYLDGDLDDVIGTSIAEVIRAAQKDNPIISAQSAFFIVSVLWEQTCCPNPLVQILPVDDDEVQN